MMVNDSLNNDRIEFIQFIIVNLMIQEDTGVHYQDPDSFGIYNFPTLQEFQGV